MPSRRAAIAAGTTLLMAALALGQPSNALGFTMDGRAHPVYADAADTCEAPPRTINYREHMWTMQTGLTLAPPQLGQGQPKFQQMVDEGISDGPETGDPMLPGPVTAM